MKTVKDIYQESCHLISDQLKYCKVKYLKSIPQVELLRDSWKCGITFTTSRYNHFNEKIYIDYHFYITHKSWEKWCKKNQLQFSCLASGTLSTLLENEERQSIIQEKSEWNLALDYTRSQTIRSVAHSIQNYIIPFFEQFNESTKFIEQLTSNSLSCVTQADAVSYLIFINKQNNAQSLFLYLLETYPNEKNGYEIYKKYLDQYKKSGIPNVIENKHGYIEFLAILSYELGWEV